MKLPLVIIQIVNFNGIDALGDLFFECYESIFSQTYKNYIVHMIDNKSTDASVREIHSKFPSVKVTLVNKNIGYSANSIGLKYFRETEADYLLVMNSDAILEKHCLENLIEYMEKNKNIGAANPLIMLNQKRDILWSTGVLVNNAGFSSNENYQNNIQIRSDKKRESLLSGACMIVRKEVIQKIKLFDFIYGSYYEDSDFSLRMLSETDYAAGLAENAVCFHEVSSSYKKFSAGRDYLLLRNQYLLMMRRFPVKKLCLGLFYLFKTRIFKRNILQMKIFVFLILMSPAVFAHRIASFFRKKHDTADFIDSSYGPYSPEKITAERVKIIEGFSREQKHLASSGITMGVNDEFLGSGFSMLSEEFPLSRRVCGKAVCFIKNSKGKYIISAYPEDSRVEVIINDKEKYAGATPFVFSSESNEEILKIMIQSEELINVSYIGALDVG